MADESIAGRYRLIEPLGHGAMSSVWLADDEDLGRQVAVKTLGENADRARFEREARAAAALSHPNICQLYDYGEAGGRPYMVLELLPGGTLEERMRGDAPLGDAETQVLAEGIASGLAHAHARGLVHRDLKPANILFDVEGRPKIADFGIARMGGSGTLTEAGTVLGTASYISPEQAGGLPATPASDVYSFGVILFRMLTGRLPFVSKNAMELVRMHRDDEPPPVSAFRVDAPPQIESIAAAALRKDPADRFPDGSALLAELRSLDPADATSVFAAIPAGTGAGGGTVPATQIVRPTAARRRPTRLVPLLAALGAVLGGGAVLAYAITSGNGDTSAPPTTGPHTPTGLSLPTVAPGKTTTTAPASTQALPTASSSTVATTAPTTTAHTTTRAATTQRVTTAPPPPPITTAPPLTTAPVTTAPTTTAVTTEPPTTAVTTTAPAP